MTRSTVVSPARWTAYSVLSDWDENKGFAEDLLEAHFSKTALWSEDLRLAQALVYGVLRRLRLLDFQIDTLAQRGIFSLPPPVVRILRMAFFQIDFLERVPLHAVTNEAVALCRAAKVEGLSGLVNAVVRHFPENRERLIQALANHPRKLAIETSHPDWLVAWAIQRFGPEKAERWLQANNGEPRLYLRPVVSRILPQVSAKPTPPLSAQTSPGRRRCEASREAAERLLAMLGEGEISEDGLSVILPARSIPKDLEPFAEGLAMVQDPAAQQAAELLDPKPGERILDLCCAPGGKTVQIADLTGGKAEILAVDSNPRRLESVRENLSRCRFAAVRTECRDLLAPWKDPPAPVDAILLDVPCSGLGTLRRRVDLRYRIGRDDIGDLAAKALTLLRNASLLLRRGGRLVYSTCTLTAEENEGVVEAFLAEVGGGWELVSAGGYYPAFLVDPKAGCPVVWPDSDASFCALIKKSL